MKFSTEINAPKEKVWQILWDDATYRKWTAPFMEGSYAKGDWSEGSKMQFLSPDGSGMFSKVEKNIPNEHMLFRHLGVVNKGTEETDTEESKSWNGTTESYRLSEKNGVTTLDTEMGSENGIPKEFEGYFLAAFPKALQKIKELSEN
ncbi:MAG: SRPBCC domain-containing protein [Ignavibacteriota bacterium]